MPVAISDIQSVNKNCTPYPFLALLLEFLVNGFVAGHHDKHLNSPITEGPWNHKTDVVPK